MEFSLQAAGKLYRFPDFPSALSNTMANPFEDDDTKSLDVPIFDLELLDITGFGRGQTRNAGRRGRVISTICCSHHLLVIGTTDNAISRWYIGDDIDCDPISLPCRSEESIERIFVDPSGHHCIVTLSNGDNFYIQTKAFKHLKKISRFQGLVESIAFDRAGGTELTTRPFLLATSIGYIYEVQWSSTVE